MWSKEQEVIWEPPSHYSMGQRCSQDSSRNHQEQSHIITDTTSAAHQHSSPEHRGGRGRAEHEGPAARGRVLRVGAPGQQRVGLVRQLHPVPPVVTSDVIMLHDYCCSIIMHSGATPLLRGFSRKNICCQKIFGNSFSFQATEMVLTSKWGRIQQEIQI